MMVLFDFSLWYLREYSASLHVTKKRHIPRCCLFRSANELSQLDVIRYSFASDHQNN